MSGTDPFSMYTDNHSHTNFRVQGAHLSECIFDMSTNPPKRLKDKIYDGKISATLYKLTSLTRSRLLMAENSRFVTKSQANGGIKS